MIQDYIFAWDFKEEAVAEDILWSQRLQRVIFRGRKNWLRNIIKEYLVMHKVAQ